jgi:hypothetical protein
MSTGARNKNLETKQAQFDSVMRTTVHRPTFQTLWTIDNFRFLMKTSKERKAIDAVPQTFPIAGGVVTVQLRCTPLVTESLGYAVQSQFVCLWADLSFPAEANRWATVHYGLLKEDGTEHILTNTVQDNAARISAEIEHRTLLDSTNKPLLLPPNNRLTIFFKIWCSALATTEMVPSGLLPQRDGRPENMSSVMLDTFVHIERGSVRLVFEDGELDCHTFPLALRNVRVLHCNIESTGSIRILKRRKIKF